jgi:signal transduction histidine kinase
MSVDMNHITGRVKTARISSPLLDPERRLLALESISKLTSQFAGGRTFENDIRVFLWTLSGQMSAPNTFAVIKCPVSSSSEFLHYATGSFEANDRIKSISWESRDFSHFLNRPGVHSIDGLMCRETTRSFAADLKAAGVSVVCPLLHDTELVGMIGLGTRIGRKPYSGQDAALILTLANTLTPFIMNAMLFEDMTNLVNWHTVVLNSVKHGLVVFGDDLRLKSANRAATSILEDLNPYCSELKSMKGVPLQMVFPDDVFPGWADKLSAASCNEEPENFVNMLARVGESERVFNLGIVQTHGISDSGHDSIVTIEDVSSQRFSERKLIDLHRLADRGMLASSIAHELNNFLGMIIGGIQLAAEASEKDDSEGLERNLSQLQEAAMKMKRYTAGLTDFGKIESSTKITNLNDIILEVLSFTRVQRKFSHINVAYNLDPAVPVLELDSDQIAQLLLNFTNNSAEAIRESGRTDGEIVVTTRVQDEGIVLAVEDNGAGMPPEVKKRLFSERYTTKPNGHGFGLFTCAKIASAHGAGIRVESEVSVGTRIEVVFPPPSHS